MKADRKRFALHQEQFNHPARKMQTISQINQPYPSQIKMNQAPLSPINKTQAKKVFSPMYTKNATLIFSPTNKRRNLLLKRDKHTRSVASNSKSSVEHNQTTNTDLEDRRVDTQQTGSYSKNFQVEIIQKFLPVLKRTFVNKDSGEVSKSLNLNSGQVEKQKTPNLATVQQQMMFIQEVDPPTSKSQSQKCSSIFTEESSESGFQTNQPTPADSKKNTPKKPLEKQKVTDNIKTTFNIKPDLQQKPRQGTRNSQIQIIEQFTEESPAKHNETVQTFIRSNTKMAENRQSLALSSNYMLSPKSLPQSGAFKSTLNALSNKDGSGLNKLYISKISVDRTYKTSLNVFDKEKTTAQLQDYIKKAEIDLERERSERHSSKQESVMRQKESLQNSAVQSPLSSVFVQKLGIGLDKRLSKPLHDLTSKLMQQATEMKNTEKSFYNPININEYNKDIQARKQMLYQLDSQRAMLIKKLEFVQNQKFFNEEKLKLANKKYYATILQSVITIQRWFKSWRIRRFLKTILSRDLELRKKDLVIALNDMQKHIRMQETLMTENLKKIRIQGELEQQEKNKLVGQMGNQEYKAWVYVEFDKRFTKVTHFISRHKVGRAFDVMKQKLQDEEIQRELIIRKQEYQVRRKFEEEERAREMASPQELKVHIQKRVKPALAQFMKRRIENKTSSMRYTPVNINNSGSSTDAATLMKKVANHFLSGRRASSRQQLLGLPKIRQKTSESLLIESPGLKNDKPAKQSPSAIKNSDEETQEGFSKQIQISKKNKAKKGLKKKFKKKNTQSDENVSKISGTEKIETGLFEEISLKEIALPGSRVTTEIIEEESSRPQSPLTNLLKKLQKERDEPLYDNKSLSHVHPNDLQYTQISNFGEPYFTEQDDYIKTEAQITQTEVSPLIKTEDLSYKLNANNLIEFDYEQEALNMEERKVKFNSFNARELEAVQPEIVRKKYSFQQQANRTESEKQASLKYVMDLVALHAKGKFQQALNFQMKDKRQEDTGLEVFTTKLKEFAYKYKQEGGKQPMGKKVMAGLFNKLVGNQIKKSSSKKINYNADVSKSKATNVTFDRRKSSALDLDKRSQSSKRRSSVKFDKTNSINKLSSKQINISNQIQKTKSDKANIRRISTKQNVTNALKSILQEQVMVKTKSHLEEDSRHTTNEVQSKKIILNLNRIDSKINELDNNTSEQQSVSVSSSDSLASLDQANIPTVAEAKQKQSDELFTPIPLELPTYHALNLKLKNKLGPSALTIIQSELSVESLAQKGKESQKSMSDLSQHSRLSKASKTSKQSRRKNSSTAIKLPYLLSDSKKNSSIGVPQLQTKSKSQSLQSKLIRLSKGRGPEMQSMKSKQAVIKESEFSSSSSSESDNPKIKIADIDSLPTTENMKTSFKQHSSQGKNHQHSPIDPSPGGSSVDSIQLFFDKQSQENYSPKEISPINYGNYHGVFASEKDVLVRKDSKYKLRIDVDKEILEKIEKQKAHSMMERLARGKILSQIIAKIQELKLQELKEQNLQQVEFHKKLKNDLQTENYNKENEEEYNIEEILANEHPQEAKIVSHLQNLIKQQSELQRQQKEVLLDWEEPGINPIERLARYLKLKRAEKIQTLALEQDRRDEVDLLKRTSKGYDMMIRNKEETVKKRKNLMIAMDQIDSLLSKLGRKFPSEKTQQQAPVDIFYDKKEANTNGPKFIALKRPKKK